MSYVKISQIYDKSNEIFRLWSKNFPSQISKDSGILQNHISAVLRQLKEPELVECINPEVRKDKSYRLTNNSEKIVSKVY